MTLFEMWNGGYRRNGGLGFTVEKPAGIVVVSKAKSFSVSDVRTHSLNATETTNLLSCIAKVSPSPVHVEISGELPSHFGFGSGTAVRLAVIEGISILFGLGLHTHDLVAASGRGGTSGIGIQTYFEGGIALDAGIKCIANKDAEFFAPSSAVEGRKQKPTLLAKSKMPNWKIGLCIPQTINPLNHKEEVDFFAKVCPIPRRHVVDTIYHSIFGAYASALDNDLTGFCKAVDSIQKTRWKASERMIYGPKLRTLENAIRSAGALGLGLSSMGPGLFYFASDVDAVTESLRRLAKDELWIATKCDNSGRQVID